MSNPYLHCGKVPSQEEVDTMNQGQNEENITLKVTENSELLSSSSSMLNWNSKVHLPGIGGSTVHHQCQSNPHRIELRQELAALSGCVSRRRAVFSPEPCIGPLAGVPGSNDELAIDAYHEERNLTPNKGDITIKNNTGQGVRQYSQEYDHLDDLDFTSDPGDYTCNKKSCSFSVQFRSEAYYESATCVTLNAHNQCSRLHQGYSRVCTQPQLCPHITSIKHSDRIGQHQMRNCVVTLNSDLDLSREYCSTWPRNYKNEKHCLASENCTESVPFTLNSTKTNVTAADKPTLQPLYPKVAENFVHQDADKSLYCMGIPLENHLNNLDSLWSLHSHCCEQPLLPYRKGVDGALFKARMETLLSWFEDFSDQQRNSLLGKLLEKCNSSQMHLLSIYMEPILHHGCPHNCQDPLAWFPRSVSFRVLSFLDPVSLCQASRVNSAWNTLANDPELWAMLCKNLLLSAAGESKQLTLHRDADGNIQWKAMFSERFRLRRNWLKGYCTVRTFEGHTQGISCVQFDETRIVSGSWDKTIKVWNRRTNTAWVALTLSGHSGTVQCLHLHKNRLVSGSSDRTIKVWDLATDKVGWVGAACRATMVGHLHTVRCLQADDDKVISGSYDHTLKIWDIRTGECKMTLRGHMDAVLCLQFDDRKVVSGSKDTSIKVWDLPDGACKLTLYGHQAAVTCLQFDERRVISGALDRLIKIWNIFTGECIQTLDWIRSEGHTGVVRHLQADRWKIVSAADDKTMKVWSVDTGARLLTLRSHSDGVTCLQFNDEVIVSGSYDKTVKLWDFSVC